MNRRDIVRELAPIAIYREWIRQSKEERTAGGRPTVVVSADYGRLPGIGPGMRNSNEELARDLSCEFSAPVVVPDGFVASDLPYPKKGLPFLEPEGEIGPPWGLLREVASGLRERGIEGGIRMTTRHDDLAGEPSSTGWTLGPLLFEDDGIGSSRGTNEPADAVEKVPESNDGEGRSRSSYANQWHETARQKGDGACY